MKWKKTSLLILLIIGMMQVFPFIPNHTSCAEACCIEAVSCCDAGEQTGCEMAMTSCSVALFLPLVSAPLVKVETQVTLHDAPMAIEIETVLESQDHSNHGTIDLALEGFPPGTLPLLI